jgi:putative transposase
VVIEDLDLGAMKKSMGRRAFRRSVSDAALGQIRPQLTYKMAWRGTTLTVASLGSRPRKSTMDVGAP